MAKDRTEDTHGLTTDLGEQRFPISIDNLYISYRLAQELLKDRETTKEQAATRIRYLMPDHAESSETIKVEGKPLDYGAVTTVRPAEVTRAQVRLHRTLGRRLFSTGSGSHSGFALTDEQVKTFLGHVEDLLRAYNAIAVNQLGLVDLVSVSTFPSVANYLLPTVFAKTLHRMGLGSAATRPVDADKEFRTGSIQEIEVNIWEEASEAVQNVRHGKATFALVVFDEAYRRYGQALQVREGITGHLRDGVIAEPLPYTEPGLGLVYLRKNEKQIFTYEDGSEKNDLAEILSDNTLILPGVDRLSHLLRELFVNNAKKRAGPNKNARAVILRSPTYRHLKNLVKGGAGIGVGEVPVSEKDDPELGFKPFSSLTIDERLRLEFADASQSYTYALYYPEKWEKPVGQGGIPELKRRRIPIEGPRTFRRRQGNRRFIGRAEESLLEAPVRQLVEDLDRPFGNRIDGNDGANEVRFETDERETGFQFRKVHGWSFSLRRRCIAGRGIRVIASASSPDSPPLRGGRGKIRGPSSETAGSRSPGSVASAPCRIRPTNGGCFATLPRFERPQLFSRTRSLSSFVRPRRGERREEPYQSLQGWNRSVVDNRQWLRDSLRHRKFRESIYFRRNLRFPYDGRPSADIAVST